jgi:gluconolactonase
LVLLSTPSAADSHQNPISMKLHAFITPIIVIMCLSLSQVAFPQERTTDPILSLNAKVIQLFNEGDTFLEGPTMSPDGILFFSDITFTEFSGMKAGHIWSLNPITKESKIYRSPSGMANGMMFDNTGDLIVCEMADHGGRRLTKTDMKTGKARIIASLYRGRPFNSPNDLAIDEKNRIYFTDPRYIGYEAMEQPVQGVYRIDTDNSVHLIAANIDQPNGILVSPDQQSLYVANCKSAGSNLPSDYKGVRPSAEGAVFAYDLAPDGSVQLRGKLVDFGQNVCADGMAIDRDGNLYVALGDRVGIYSPQGKIRSEIKVRATNLCFGVGRYSKTLFIVGGKGVNMVETLKEGYNVLRVANK